MRIILDLECNALHNPTKIWVAVAKDLDTSSYHIFRDIHKSSEKEKFLEFINNAKLIVGHNLLGYDFPVLEALIEAKLRAPGITEMDTLILSKLIDYPRDGHSVGSYGEEFGLPKGDHSDWSKYTSEMEEYCIRDVDITERIFKKYKKYIDNPERQASIILEHEFQLVCNSLEKNGFAFNVAKAQTLLDKVNAELAVLDKDILTSFPPREVLIKTFTPRATKFGTISRTSVPRTLHHLIDTYEVGSEYQHTKLVEFNPSSHKQIIQVLNEAGWKPTDKTKTHIETERSLNKMKRSRVRNSSFDIEQKILYDKYTELQKVGWKVNENNLESLPDTAPKGARIIAKRIQYEARRRTLTEWLNLVWLEIEIKLDQLGTSGTVINGKQILSGENANEKRIDVGEKTTLKNPELATANPTSREATDYRSKILLKWLKTNKVDVQFVSENASSMSIIVIGRERLENFSAAIATVPLAGTKSIPVKYTVTSSRIHGRFNGIGAWSHRMNHQNPNTANIPNEYDTFGKKKLYGKELRSLWMAPKNRLLIGCDAEGIQLRIFAHYINDPEFTEALIKGRKDDKTDPHSLNQRILGDACKSRAAAKRFIYALLLGAGLGKLAEILGCSSERAQEALDRLISRYSGWAALKEEVFPKDAKRGWFLGLDGRAVRIPGDTESNRRHLAMSGYLQNGEAVCMKKATLRWLDKLKPFDGLLVNFVHDEWQVEGPNNVNQCIEIAKLMANSLTEVGEELNLNCPLAGSYYNDDDKDYTIATNWSKTH